LLKVDLALRDVSSLADSIALKKSLVSGDGQILSYLNRAEKNHETYNNPNDNCTRARASAAERAGRPHVGTVFPWLVANAFLEAQVEEIRADVSNGYGSASESPHIALLRH
jgi:hypothetical protein